MASRRRKKNVLEDDSSSGDEVRTTGLLRHRPVSTRAAAPAAAAGASSSSAALPGSGFAPPPRNSIASPGRLGQASGERRKVFSAGSGRQDAAADKKEKKDRKDRPKRVISADLLGDNFNPARLKFERDHADDPNAVWQEPERPENKDPENMSMLAFEQRRARKEKRFERENANSRVSNLIGTRADRRVNRQQGGVALSKSLVGAGSVFQREHEDSDDDEPRKKRRRTGGAAGAQDLSAAVGSQRSQDPENQGTGSPCSQLSSGRRGRKKEDDDPDWKPDLVPNRNQKRTSSWYQQQRQKALDPDRALAPRRIQPKSAVAKAQQAQGPGSLLTNLRKSSARFDFAVPHENEGLGDRHEWARMQKITRRVSDVVAASFCEEADNHNAWKRVDARIRNGRTNLVGNYFPGGGAQAKFFSRAAGGRKRRSPSRSRTGSTRATPRSGCGGWCRRTRS